MGYSMIEMIDNRLDQLFPQRDLYTFSPFSVEDLRDNIIMFIIKDAYAESERKKSLRANRGTDSDADRMRDSRNIAYAQHYRNLQYERPTIKSQVDFEKKLKNFRNKKLHDNKACTSANQNQ